MKTILKAAMVAMLAVAGTSAFAQASDAMGHDSMAKDSMSHDSMSHDSMGKDSMSHESMSKKGDKMAKHDAMGMNHPASGAMSQ